MLSAQRPSGSCVVDVVVCWGHDVVDVCSVRAGEVAVVAGHRVGHGVGVDAVVEVGDLRLLLRSREAMSAAPRAARLDLRWAKIMATSLLICVGTLAAAFITPPSLGRDGHRGVDVRRDGVTTIRPLLLGRPVGLPPTTPPRLPRKAHRRLRPEEKKVASAMPVRASTSTAAKRADDVALATTATKTTGGGGGNVGATLQLDLEMVLQNLRTFGPRGPHPKRESKPQRRGPGGDVASDGVVGVVGDGGVAGVGNGGGGGGGGGGVLGISGGGKVNPRGRGHRPGRVVGVMPGRVKAGLERGEVQRIITTALPQIRFCYARELGRTPSLDGRLVMAWSIDGVGDVTNVSVVDNDVGSAVADCVTRTLKALTFPAPMGGGVVDVSFPFVFSNSGT